MVDYSDKLSQNCGDELQILLFCHFVVVALIIRLMSIYVIRILSFFALLILK
jgi:hypothetical protein